MTVSQTARSNLTDLNTFKHRDYWQLVGRLHQARNALADGPAVLALLNEIALVCDALFETDIDDEGRISSPCPGADSFLARFAVECDRSRAANGEISETLLDLLDEMPTLPVRNAA